jgi:hypothetical protein
MENSKETDLNSWPDSMINREQERLDKHMIAAFRHAANSIAVTSGVIKSHISQDEAEQSVAGDQYFLELISEAELRIGMQEISFECQTTLLNSCEKALAERDAQIERLKELKLERDRWFAATHNLTETLSGIRDFIASLPIDALGSGSSPDCGEWSRRDEVTDTISCALRKAPAQSLAEHDAALLERIADKYQSIGAVPHLIHSSTLRGEAAQIRQEALSNG